MSNVQAKFLPSEVDLNTSFPPLVATMGKSEMECAAAILVRACVRHGDTWQSVSLKMAIDTFCADVKERISPICHIASNPFCSPDFDALVNEGFAQRTEESITLLPAGLERLLKHVRC